MRDPPMRRAYIRLFADPVIVADGEIRIGGPAAAIEKAASEEGESTPPAMAPGSIRGWYPERDSNPCYRRERAVS